MFNNWLDILSILSILFDHSYVQVPLQLLLHHFIMNLKEVILLVYVFDLSSQAFLRIRELLTKVFVLFSLLLRRLLKNRTNRLTHHADYWVSKSLCEGTRHLLTASKDSDKTSTFASSCDVSNHSGALVEI